MLRSRPQAAFSRGRTAQSDPSVAMKKDFTQIALDVVRRATGEAIAPAPTKKSEGERNKVANKPAKARKSRKA